MKIAKALKLKNRLAGEIARLKGIAQANNSREDSQEANYDVKTVVTTTLPNKVGDLVAVKTIIACSNAGADVPKDLTSLSQTPYCAIFMIAELKGLIQSLGEMNTKNGPHNEHRGFGIGNTEPKPVVYVAAVKQGEVDGLVANYQEQIDALQDALDAHNATVDSVLLDGIKI